MEPSSQVASEPQTPQAITNYNSIFNGGSHNIAQGSSQVSQAVNMNQPAGDLDALLSRLRDLRLPEETLDELMVAIEADTDESGHPQWGARLRTWIGNLCSAIFVEGVASGIVNNSSDIPHVIEEVHKAISSYVG